MVAQREYRSGVVGAETGRLSSSRGRSDALAPAFSFFNSERCKPCFITCSHAICVPCFPLRRLETAPLRSAATSGHSTTTRRTWPNRRDNVAPTSASSRQQALASRPACDSWMAGPGRWRTTRRLETTCRPAKSDGSKHELGHDDRRMHRGAQAGCGLRTASADRTSMTDTDAKLSATAQAERKQVHRRASRSQMGRKARR